MTIALRAVSSREEIFFNNNTYRYVALLFKGAQVETIIASNAVRKIAPIILKRVFDIIVSLAALLFLSPLFIVVAAAIYLSDRGSVLFIQKRVGKDGQEFDFPKFRSMVLNADRIKEQLLKQNDHSNSITFKMKKDPRVTWIGRIIRKTSIDELPQFWSVLKGDMTLVGPRPAVPSEVAQYSKDARKRLTVKPGLTCIWQVSGRSDVPFEQQLKMDMEYILKSSFLFDIKLLLATVPAVVTARGAY